MGKTTKITSSALQFGIQFVAFGGTQKRSASPLQIRASLGPVPLKRRKQAHLWRNTTLYRGMGQVQTTGISFFFVGKQLKTLKKKCERKIRERIKSIQWEEANSRGKFQKNSGA